MKYLDEFRDGDTAQRLIERINDTVDSDIRYRIMEFCGGHTHTLFRFGIPDMLPAPIDMLHGPGCPVCVLPISRIDAAIALAERPDVILCSYGDMLRVPGTDQMSLLKAKAKGARVEMVYSPSQILEIAKANPDAKVVFFAVGFETTTPPTALMMDEAEKQEIENLYVFCNHVLTPPAIQGILEPGLESGERILEGLIGPGHVSLITGSDAYLPLAERYQVPIVISGFEPLDLLHSILLLVQQINAGTCQVENQYTRAVTPEGNSKAQSMIAKYFLLRDDFEWRGLGRMPHSALAIRPEFRHRDAEYCFEIPPSHGVDNKACECPAVLTGRKKPDECKLFGKPCTPFNPLGSCMVSSEGACAAYYTYNQHLINTESL